MRAWNTWGLESGTRFPAFIGNNRFNSSIQEMLLTATGPLQFPKLILENRKSPGLFQNVTLDFRQESWRLSRTAS